MTRSLGRLAKVGELDIATRLRLENDAICMGLPVAPTGSIELRDAGTNDKRIEVTQDGSNSGTFVVRNEGTVYSKSSINPSFQNNATPAACTLGLSSQQWQGVYSTAYHFPDGTTQTTAAGAGATPGMVLDAVYTIPSGPGFVTPDLVTAGALGEVGKWKIVVSNLETDALVGFNYFFTRAGGAQLDGTQNGQNWSNGMLATNSAVTYPGLPIEMNESVDSVRPGTRNQLEIDIQQKTGDAGFATSRFSYTNTTGLFRVATRNFQTNPSQDIAGFNIRGTGPSNMQGTIYVYKYSSV